MPEKLRVLVVGLGHMGVTHAKAYDRLDGYELAGLCCRSIANRDDIVKTWPTGHTISAIDGRMTAAGAKPKGPFVLPGFIDLHVHGGGGGDWQGGEEGVRTFVHFHTSCGTTVIAPTTAIGPIPVIEKSLSAITSIAAARLPGEAVVLGAHLEGPFINPLKPGAMEASLILEGDAARARGWAERF
jgi:N-acetylglucosamine-6-phosphate deacetylase